MVSLNVGWLTESEEGKPGKRTNGLCHGSCYGACFFNTKTKYKLR